MIGRYRDLGSKIIDSCSSGSRGLVTCEELVSRSCSWREVISLLKETGFETLGVRKDVLATLFFSMYGCVYVVKDEENARLVTSSSVVLNGFVDSGVIVAREDDDVLLSKTLNTIKLQRIKNINTRLENGLIKSVELKPASELEFRCTVKGAVLDISSCKCYPISVVNKHYHNVLSDLVHEDNYIELISGRTMMCRIKEDMNRTATYPYFRGTTLNGVSCRVPIFGIRSVSYGESSTSKERLLEKGVYRIELRNGAHVNATNNMDMVRQFYGNDYLKYETLGGRCSLALSEINRTLRFSDLAYYINKYRLHDSVFDDVRSMDDLIKVLSIHKKSLSVDKSKLLVRVLIDSDDIKEMGYTFTINKNEIVGFRGVSIGSITPSMYRYSTISDTHGYVSMDIKADSFDGALAVGKREYEKRYGSNCSCVGLYSYSTNKTIFGIEEYSIPFRMASMLHKAIVSSDYVRGYSEYSLYIRKIALLNKMDFITDDAIKLIFINQLAKECRSTEKVTLSLMLKHLLNFMSICSNGQISMEREIDKCRLMSLERKVKHEYLMLREEFNNIKESDFNITSIVNRFSEKYVVRQESNTTYKVMSGIGAYVIVNVNNRISLSTRVGIIRNGMEMSSLVIN